MKISLAKPSGRLATSLALAVAALAIGITSSLAAGEMGLPGGATSLQETYQDWQVSCAVQGMTKSCVFLQRQAQENGSTVLVVELAPTSGNALSGTLVLPFGLLFSPGVELRIDDKAVGNPLPFRTCLPTGCLVPLAFDDAIVKALRTGTVLKLTATRNGDSQPVTFSVSLKGFAPALDRTRTLLKG